MAVEGPNTRPIVFSMIPGSYCRRRRRFTIFVPDAMKLVCKQDHRKRLGGIFLLLHILEKV